MSEIEPLLWRMAIYGPLFIVWIIGTILSLTRWRKHPQVSLLAFVGFVLQLFQSGAGIAFDSWIMSPQALALNWSGEQLTRVCKFFFSTQTCLSAVGWALILLAIFRWRNQPNRILGHDGQYLPEGFDPGTKTAQRGEGDVFYRPHP